MLRNIYLVICYPHIFLRIWFCNKRFKKTGKRKYQFTMYEEIPKILGGGFKKIDKIIIECGLGEEKINENTTEILTTGKHAYNILRDDYQDIFVKCDHYKRKEIY